MRPLRFALLLSLLFALACQPPAPATVSIIDGNQLRIVATQERTASAILAQAGVIVSPADELLFNGYRVAPDADLEAGSGTLQVRRALSVSIGGKSRQTTARTVGEALSEAGLTLHAADSIAPPAASSLATAEAVSYEPARELIVEADAQERRILSSASTVSGALAQAGLPLLGLDYSQPPGNEPLPTDGRIRVVRVSESLLLTEKSIPFKNEYRDSGDVEAGMEQIVQPGVQGLSVSRIRIRYEDGKEVSRQTEAETVVRPPQNRISLRGTKIVLKTATVDGVKIQYWLKLQMYATIYSPCNSGTGGCSSGTASGLKAGKGVVAVDPGLYAYVSGQRLYVPGYGSAVIGDVGGGHIVEQNTGVSRYRWIDLGFDDNNITDMSGWITVYFLAPAPAAIPEILK
jgi:uncharacterized protein YabE (DUF348 family)